MDVNPPGAKAPPPPARGPSPRQRHRSYRRSPLRWWLFGAVLLLVGALAGHALLWRWVAGELERGFGSWAEMRRAQGWRVEHGAPQRGGWPFSVTLTLPDFRMEGGGATVPGGIAWRSEQVVLTPSLPRPERIRVDMLGPQSLRLGRAELSYQADRLFTRLPLEAGAMPRQGEIGAERLRIGTPDGPMDVGALRVEFATRGMATAEESALDLGVAAQRIDLPAPPGGAAGEAFGRRIDLLSAEAALTGPVPGGRHPTDRAGAWRDGGGMMELRALQLRWGPVGASVAATLALDDALQPMGAGTVRLTGAQDALDALAASGVIGDRAATTARAVLVLLQRTPEGGGQPVVEVPLTLEDRSLSVARFRVLRMPPLVWPAPPGASAATR